MNKEALSGLARLAAQQHGLFGSAHARALGLTAKEVEGGARAGLWSRLYRGVYRMRGAPVTEPQALLAAVLACGPGAMASHRGAAWLWDLLPTLCLEVGGPGQHRPSTKVQYHRLAGDVRAIRRRSIPCTGPLLTVLHVASKGDEALVVSAVDRGIANGLFTAAALDAELDRRARKGVRGVALLRDVLGHRLDAEGERTSALESAMDRLLVATGCRGRPASTRSPAPAIGSTTPGRPYALQQRSTASPSTPGSMPSGTTGSARTSSCWRAGRSCASRGPTSVTGRQEWRRPSIGRSSR